MKKQDTSKKFGKAILKKKGTLRITLDLYSKILHLCSQISKVEWSGVLFFTVKEGNLYEPEGLIVEAIDLHLMDIDSAAATEFEYGPELIEVYEKHPEYMEDDVRMGSIHSHHSMGAFFSGTDDTELKSGSDSGDFYLMLIVNNTLGDWVAKVGFSVEVKKSWTSIFKFKNDKTLSKKGSSENSEYINYDLDIKIPFTPEEDVLKELDDRIVEIRKKKTAAANKFTGYPKGYSYGVGHGHGGYYNSIHKTNGVVSFGNEDLETSVGFRTKVDKKDNKKESEKPVILDEEITDLILNRWMKKNEKITHQAAVREMSKQMTPDKYIEGLESRITTYLYGEDVSPGFVELLFKKLRRPFLQVNTKWSRAVSLEINGIESDLDWFGSEGIGKSIEL